jgi:putative protease
MKKYPEILAPAGDLSKLKLAIAYGCNAVYCGLPQFSLRARENSFSLADLRKARKITAEAGVKLYFTFNIYPRSNQLAALEKALKQIKEIKPDAIILADAGVFNLVKKIIPKMKIHLSVQANTVNLESVKFWYSQGVKRVVVARELSLKEIITIKKAIPKMELEMFVHGAICMSYSGRCLLSLFLTNRDANRGICSQPCRWNYKLMEEKREGEYLPIEEDKHGSYILNSKDMCLLPYLDKISTAGISALKIEGRNKSIGYLATVLHAYKQALDDLKAGKKFNSKLMKEFSTTGNREFTTGFFTGNQQDLQNYSRSAGENPQAFIGVAEKYKAGKVLFEVKNRIDIGDKIEILIPCGEILQMQITELWDEKNQPIKKAHAGQNAKAWLKVSEEIPTLSLLRKCQK